MGRVLRGPPDVARGPTLIIDIDSGDHVTKVEEATTCAGDRPTRIGPSGDLSP